MVTTHKPTKHSHLSKLGTDLTDFREVLEELKSIPILDVFKKLNIDVTNFTTVGNNLAGDCPTGHKSTSGRSFHITPDINLYHCWNCGIGGDNIKLVEDLQGLTFFESLEWLVNSFNLNIDLSKFTFKKRTPEQLIEEQEQKIFTLLYNYLIQWGKDILYDPTSADLQVIEAIKYLTVNRKYDLEALKTTEIFYIPNTQEAKDVLLRVYPEYKTYIEKLPIAGGQLGDKAKINIPYRLSNGTITGLVKRASSAKGYPGPDNSYIRWDSTPGLKKPELFGLHGLRKLNKNTTKAIIVEGYPDVVYLQALGLEVLALGSASSGDSQLNSILKLKHLKTVTLALDNDNAGRANSAALLHRLTTNTDLTVNVLPASALDPHKDIDEYCRFQGIYKTKELLDLEEELGIEWFVKQAKERHHGVLKSEDLDEVFKLLAHSPISVQGLLYSKSKQLLNMNVGNLRQIISTLTVDTYRKRYKVENRSNYLLKWDLIPFASGIGYGIYDKSQKVPDLTKLDRDSVKKQLTYEKIKFFNTKGLMEDVASSVMSLPPILPRLEPEYDPHNFYDIDLKEGKINTFIPTKWMYMENNGEIISPQAEFPVIYDFLTHLLGSGPGVDTHYILNWLAAIFNERRKLRTSLVITGTQGAGKNVFVDFIIKMLFGLPNVSVVGDSQLTSQYTDYLQDKLFLVFNELGETKEGKRSQQAFLKGLITDEIYALNRKYRDISYKIAWFNFIFISNDLLPLAVDVDDRRFTVVRVPDMKLHESKFWSKYGWKGEGDFDNFRKSVEDEFPRFAQYLKNMSYDINLANTAIMNHTKLSMITGINTVFSHFAMLIKSHDAEELKFLQLDGTSSSEKEPYEWHPEHKKQGVIEVNQALNIINSIADFKSRINVKTLTNKMFEAGIQKARLRLDCPWKNDDQGRSHFFVLPGSPKWSDPSDGIDYTPEEIEEGLKSTTSPTRRAVLENAKKNL